MPDLELPPELVLTPQLAPPIAGAPLVSPYHFQFTGEDSLEIASFNSLAGVRVAVHGRVWDRHEGIKPFGFTHVPNTDRTRALEPFGIQHGVLLNVVAFAESGDPKIGQTFVSLHVIRGRGQARKLLATLLQGYVTTEQELAFPGSAVMSSIEGGGYTRTIEGTDPAAGNDIIETVPTGARWRVEMVGATLVTDATAGNRRPQLQFRTAAGSMMASYQAITIPASTGLRFQWASGMPLDTSIGTVGSLAGLPTGVVLLAGQTILITHVGFVPADNWGAPTLHVEEWLEA